MRNGFRASMLLISLGYACNSQAQEPSGAYLGASVGEATNQVGAFKDSDTAFKLSAGYAFNQYFGVELAYLDAGTQSDTVGNVHLENELASVIASSRFNLPLGDQFAVFGKFGYVLAKSDTIVRRGDLAARESTNNANLAYGVGIELAVFRGLRLRGEYEILNVSVGDFDVVSAGIIYRF